MVNGEVVCNSLRFHSINGEKEHYCAYVSLAKLRFEMSSKARLYENAIKKSWIALIEHYVGKSFVDRKSSESLVSMERKYLDEVERIEIELHSKFISITEKLSQLFGPDIKKQLKDGWSFEIYKYLSDCKRKVLPNETDTQGKS